MQTERPHDITHYALRQCDDLLSLDLCLHLLNIDKEQINRATYSLDKINSLSSSAYTSVNEILTALNAKI